MSDLSISRSSSSFQLRGLSQVSRPRPQPSSPPEHVQASPKSFSQTRTPALGSKAQIKDILKEIETIDLRALSEQSPSLGKLKTLKKYLGKPVGMLDKGVFGGFYRNADHRKLAQKIQESGHQLSSWIEGMHEDRKTLGSLVDAIRQERELDSPDELKISRLLGEGQQILKKQGLDPQGTLLLGAINSPQLPDRVLDALSMLSSAQEVLQFQAQGLSKDLRQIAESASPLKKESKVGFTSERAGLLQKISPLTSFANLIAQISRAKSHTDSWKEALTHLDKADKLVKGAPLNIIAGVAGGLQIIAEGAELVQNYSKRKQALSRMETARLTLASPEERTQYVSKLQKQLGEVQSGHWYTSKSSRLKKAEALQEKIAGIQQLHRHLESHPLSDQSKQVAQQIISRGDTKFKAAKIIKNLVGMTAGAIGIAVAVGALATPVGWIAAGVALAGTVGCFAYAKYRMGQREKKIGHLMQGQAQAKLKIQDGQQERGKTQEQIQNLKHNISLKIDHLHQEMSRGILPQDSEEAQQRSQEIDAMKELLGRLEEHEQALGGSIEKLQGMQTQLTLSLLATSPKHASEAIYEGATASPPDQGMLYLAQTVLHVNLKLPKEQAMALMQRGMTLDPRF
ncbi:hypothetical protein COW36_10515 [bacterium (Candidatus Blackallbacteria) CG17_big_fil_post_rev_8_21_14_2_50_48_46]|uniref:Uncharacterized protein n=1 Tax=bacterium (Candidatus Blackallbacteria) CG17_big_fil_post_rev_8_21_14_2_50_48_46 TaxID=2014261 RepID=A0A2M7G551_9BACT|nr:MAG: hypothetical protein COW64_20290 [bacterium (Candidatus Blackallbacteria) CG18_big_fil_WC_8_21_14_2_50_49_26]PIW17063.1 MAG: hypothetical protein COW36_10515 [bacterium (Candidatus Blackallbacteria) CG17_big_fil_post_rev_8_21_14_2_50_48_46]PIW47702.1 MAG: hypothetical protein COW20_11705 [bacterium (Candidatus Blackallbacteria) CG13_big_fil_rev_8_21_14_2_50_49_14]